MKTTITVSGKTSHVRVSEVGQKFGTSAHVTIGGRQFNSTVKPFGFESAAISDVIEQVLSIHPSAKVTER